MEVPVMHVRQKASGVESVINVADFDPTRHEAVEAPEVAAAPVVEPEKAKRGGKKKAKSETVDVDDEAGTDPEFIDA